MIVDKKHRWIYLPTTEADKAVLTKWAKGSTHLQAVSDLSPEQKILYRRCCLTRPDGERLALGLRSLVESDPGRRFANRYQISDFERVFDLLREYPEVRQDLLDFSSPPSADTEIPVHRFGSFLEGMGYDTFPVFPSVEPTHEDLTPTQRTTPTHGVFITYVNVESDTVRRNETEQAADNLGWTVTRTVATTPKDIDTWSTVEGYEHLPRSRQIEYALSVSHLRALQSFVASGCRWGLILEDDIDLGAVWSWDFSLTDLTLSAPDDCGILQLQMIWPITALNGNHVTVAAPESLALRSHVPGRDWATGAYLVRREYALDILRRFRGGRAHFDFNRYPGLPVADVWIYDNTFFSPLWKAYSTPLLYVRAQDAAAGVQRDNMRLLMERASREFAKQLAARKGDKVKLSDIFQPVTPTDYPFVSLITPTYNRRHLLPLLEACILRQTYPRCRMEWILVDDSQDGQPAFTHRENTGLAVKHIVLPEKMVLGAKRNFTVDQAQGQICVYLDDDDYYPPTRVQLSVEALQKRPDALLAGSTFIPIYYTAEQEFWVGGPWGAQHTTAGALAHRRIYSSVYRYDAEASFAEEKSFLANYQFPLAQMNHFQTILCLAHNANTYDKRKLLGSNKMQRPEQAITDIIPESLLQEYRSKHETHRVASQK